MQNTYGQSGAAYFRRLVAVQSLFFGLLLLVSIVWTLDQVGIMPGTPWTTYGAFWLLACGLAAWIVMLLQAVPPNDAFSLRRTKQLVVAIAAGAVLTSLLLLEIPDHGSVVGKLLILIPVEIPVLAACAASALFILQVLSDRRRIGRRLELNEQNLARLEARFGPEAVARIKLSHALEIGKATGNPRPAPRGYVIAGLTSKPFYESRELEWARRLEENYRAVRDEALQVLSNRSLLSPYTYLNQTGWNACRFVDNFRVNEEVCRRFPKTAELLKAVPHFPKFRDAMFSVLDPRTHLPPHRDGSNIYLTCHLGLVIPERCAIRIGGQVRTWTEGRCLIFDSSYEHEAWNDAETPRIVLLFDFLHPELSDVEVEWVTARDAGILVPGG